MLSCMSCARSSFSGLFTQTEDSTALAHNMLSAPVEGPASGSVVLLADAGKKNTFIIQTAPNNTANATGTDNAGRDASQGANGGHSTEESSGPGLGTFAVVAVVCLAAGIAATIFYQKRRRTLLPTIVP